MKWLLLAALFIACEPTQQIGQNGPDGSMQLTGDGSLSCSTCDASSCGERVCGRSECGFLCGTCGPGEMCLLGTGCPGGTGAQCVDAFGESVGLLDLGFRVCPTDPSKIQRCQCTDGTGNVWENCDAACIDVCTGPGPAPSTANITCGSSSCTGGDICCIPTNTPLMPACAAAPCGSNEYTRACDGPEDCATGTTCCGGATGFWTTTCNVGSGCGTNDQICHTGADCPGSKPHCCPGVLVPEISSCSASSTPDCT